MKTLHIDTGREMRGGQWQVLYLIERLKDATLLAPEESPLLGQAQKRGVAVRGLTWRTLWSLSKQCDVVHAHDAHAHSMAAIAGRGPLVVSRRVGFPIQSGFWSGRKYAFPKLYLAVSKFVAMRLHDRGIEWTRIQVVHDGVPVPETPADSRPGRVVALASKPVQIPGVSVDLTSNLWEDLSTASVFVYKSDLEGLGSAALAAMAAGVPVVASNVGGLPEAVEHERTGLLVSDGDFETPVRRLLADPEWARQLGAAGRERVKAEFSVDRMVEQTEAAYRGILDQGRTAE